MSLLTKTVLGGIIAIALACQPAWAQDEPATARPQPQNNDRIDLSGSNPNNNNPVSNSTDNLSGSGAVSGTSDTSLHGSGEAGTSGPAGGTSDLSAGNTMSVWWIGGLLLTGLIVCVVLFNLWRKPDTYSADLRSGDRP